MRNSVALLTLLMLMLMPTMSFGADEMEDEFTAKKLVVTWKLVSGEARGNEMAKDSTGEREDK